jgi:hypothetical protein
MTGQAFAATEYQHCDYRQNDAAQNKLSPHRATSLTNTRTGKQSRNAQPATLLQHVSDIVRKICANYPEITFCECLTPPASSRRPHRGCRV